MKFPIPTLAKLLPFASKHREGHRYTLPSVHWDPARGALTATDGRALAQVHVKGRRSSPVVLLSASILGLAVKATRPFARCLEIAKGKGRRWRWSGADAIELGGDVSGTLEATEGRYPEIDAVIPERADHDEARYFDAKYLRKICDPVIANTGRGESATMRLTLGKRQGPIRIDHKGTDADVVAVLMPITMSEDL